MVPSARNISSCAVGKDAHGAAMWGTTATAGTLSGNTEGWGGKDLGENVNEKQ